MDIQLKYKIAMSKFRLSNNRLNIELGRCNNVPKENRVCNCCHQSNNANVVDSEYHAFFKCVNYYIVRQTYYLTGMCLEQNFYALLSSQNPDIVKMYQFICII